jgi:predicted  nucleic acid-binding Zn-ribbon protein
MNVTGSERVNGLALAEETVHERLRGLRSELSLGESEFQELERRQRQLRDALLRISGAIQVLEELTRGEPVGATDTSGQ